MSDNNNEPLNTADPDVCTEAHDGAIEDTMHTERSRQAGREIGEPGEQYTPVNMLMLFVFGALAFWAGLYLAMYSGGWDPLVYDETAVAGGGDAGPKEELPLAVQGERIYKSLCAQCHQADGNGLPGQFPPLAGAAWVTDTKIRPISILLHGLNGPITVKGLEYNGNMPAWAENLNDKKIAAVLSFIRSSWGNAAGDIMPEEVAAMRAMHSARGAQWTEGELLELDDSMLEVTPAAAEPAEVPGEAAAE